MAEAQDLWSWTQWLRHSGRSTSLPNGSPSPIPLDLVTRLCLIPKLTAGLGLASDHEHLFLHLFLLYAIIYGDTG